MKRASQGGSSPEAKHSPFYVDDSDEVESDVTDDFSFLPSPETYTFLPSSPPVTSSAKSNESHLRFLTQASSNSQFENYRGPLSFSQASSDDYIPELQTNSEEMFPDLQETFSSPPSQPDNWNWDWSPFPSSPYEFNENASTANELVDDLVAKLGISEAASAILNHKELKDEITKRIHSSSHRSLKSSLKNSQLNAKKTDRSYLLTLSPSNLCREFQSLANPSFELVVHGLLGISEEEEIFSSQFLINNVCLIYSTISKIINRQATGYALLLTTAARDGGLREDSIKILAPLLHPRTSQKYDSFVLCKGWDRKLNKNLEEEKSHFEAQKVAESNVEQLLQNDAPEEVINDAKRNLATLLDTAPPQLQLVWDNLNLRTSHRYQRVGDEYADSNLDWMASLWIKDRISANHMEHDGVSLKSPDNLNIKDFVPTSKERDYVFVSLVRYFAYRLVQRHPNLFKAIARCIKSSRPHQFQDAMNSKSEEFTGNLFTLSESRTEDLITMMSEVQLNVHTYVDSNGVEHCHERKIVTGDNKTEKNMTYGILRFVA